MGLKHFSGKKRTFKKVLLGRKTSVLVWFLALISVGAQASLSKLIEYVQNQEKLE
jgi:hypothetical protein